MPRSILRASTFRLCYSMSTRYRQSTFIISLCDMLFNELSHNLVQRLVYLTNSEISLFGMICYCTRFWFNLFIYLRIIKDMAHFKVHRYIYVSYISAVFSRLSKADWINFPRELSVFKVPFKNSSLRFSFYLRGRDSNFEFL